MFDSLAWAMGSAPKGASGGGPAELITGFLPLIIIFAIFYFLLILPQKKKAKEIKDMLGNLKRGDKVITSGGIYGLVESVGEKTVVLKVAENVKVKFGKAYISAVRVSTEED